MVEDPSCLASPSAQPLDPASWKHSSCVVLPPRASLLPCRVSVSSMSEQQKQSIKALVVLLGGRYTVKMGDFNTHLIVPFATGEKFKAAPARGVTPVTHHWLIAMAKQGVCVPCIVPCPVLGSVTHRA